MTQEPYVIGVDCGGSHAVGIAYKLDGTVLHSVQTGPANLTVNAELAIANIKQALTELFTTVNRASCQQVLLGIAGLGAYAQTAELPQKLGLADLPVKIINDAQLALLAKLQGRLGIMIIAGTGSIVLGQLNNQTVRIGGWGHLLGDAGSGYALGQAAVKQVTRDTDHQQLSDFSQALLQHTNSENVSALVRLFYQWDKRQVAQLAPFVLTQAENGDITANTIVKQAVTALVAQISLGLQQVKWSQEQPFAVAVSGSVLEKSLFYRTAFTATLQGVWPQANLLPVDLSQNNASGVLYLPSVTTKNENTN